MYSVCDVGTWSCQQWDRTCPGAAACPASLVAGADTSCSCWRPAGTAAAGLAASSPSSPSAWRSPASRPPRLLSSYGRAGTSSWPRPTTVWRTCTRTALSFLPPPASPVGQLQHLVDNSRVKVLHAGRFDDWLHYFSISGQSLIGLHPLEPDWETDRERQQIKKSI